MQNHDVILIADAGSTKSDWCLIERSGRILAEVRTEGLNAASASVEQLEEYLLSAKSHLHPSEIKIPSPQKIFYYGAGCASEAICEKVVLGLSNIWGCHNAEVASDMLGACRGLLGYEPGVACILGTGSNSALYDGEKITANTPPLGYILGDEGGGAAIGKRFISDVFKGCAPDRIISDFLNESGLSKDDVIHRVYHQPNANRFLASFAPYISARIEDEYFKNLVHSEFAAFIMRNLLNYLDIEILPISFIGSIARHFSSQLEESLKQFNLKLGIILTSPMEGLINYHSNH